MYSKWEDAEQRTLQLLIEEIKNQNVARKKIIDPVDRVELSDKVDFLLPKNSTFLLNNEEVTYNFLKYSYEYLKKFDENEPQRDKRVGLYEAEIIIYSLKNKNYYIINKSYSPHTKRNIRRMLGYNGKNEVAERWTHGIKEDCLIWMIHYLIDKPNDYIDEKSKTLVRKITAFKGEREDSLAEINGSGEKIMDLIATLVFLFENKNISAIQALIERNDEKFMIKLGKRYIDIDFNSYEGGEIRQITEMMKAKISIKIFEDLLPNLATYFYDEQSSEKWTDKKRSLFFKNIGNSINEQVTKLINEL